VKPQSTNQNRSQTGLRPQVQFILFLSFLTLGISSFAAISNQTANTTNAFAWDYAQFALPSGAKESLWRNALAERIGGTMEFKTPAGRIDVMTTNEVIEIDRPNKWKEGMGQALAYAGATGRKPVLALMSYSQGPEDLQAKSKVTFDLAAKECARHGVRLLIVFPSLPEVPHPATKRIERK